MIDGGVFIGRNPSGGGEFGDAAFKAHLSRYGLSAAIVSSYKSIYFDDREGNEDTLRFAERHRGSVIPGITLNPLRWDAVKDASYLSDLKDRGARVLCLFSEPSYYTLNWESPLLASLVHEASRLGYAVQLGVKNEIELVQVLRCFGNLRSPLLIRWMGNAAYRGLSEILHALTSAKNVYFDIGSLTGIGMIGYLANAVDVKKLYWASNAPEQSASAGFALLQAATLPADKWHGIARASLSELLLGALKPAKDKTKGAPVWSAIKKIDTHWHLEHWNLLEPGTDERSFPALLKKHHIQKAVFSSIRALNGFMSEGNKGVFSYAARHRGVYGLVVVDPTRIARSLSEIARYASHPRCVGIKTIQDLYGLSLASPEYDKILQAAEAHKLTVMAHLPGMGEAAMRYPRIRFVAAHSTWERVKPLIDRPNIYFDLATSHRNDRETQLGRLVLAAGSDRILFASDAPLIHPAWTAGKILEAIPDKKTQEKIFFHNALKAFPRLGGRKN